MAQVNVRKTVEWWLDDRRLKLLSRTVNDCKWRYTKLSQQINLKMVNCVCFSMHGKALQSSSIIILFSTEIYIFCVNLTVSLVSGIDKGELNIYRQGKTTTETKAIKHLYVHM